MKCSMLILLFIGVTICVAQAPQSQKFPWDEHFVQGLGKPLSEETRISAADRKWLQRWLAHRYSDETDPNARALETRVRMVDLNGDGVPEVIAQAMGDFLCSPTGNCSFWAFQKAPSGYRLILEKGAAQGFTIQPNRTNGYSDVMLSMHGSASEQEFYLYQFNRDRYHRVACYDANWTYVDQKGEVEELKNPRITRCR